MFASWAPRLEPCKTSFLLESQIGRIGPIFCLNVNQYRDACKRLPYLSSQVRVLFALDCKFSRVKLECGLLIPYQTPGSSFVFKRRLFFLQEARHTLPVSCKRPVGRRYSSRPFSTVSIQNFFLLLSLPCRLGPRIQTQSGTPQPPCPSRILHPLLPLALYHPLADLGIHHRLLFATPPILTNSGQCLFVYRIYLCRSKRVQPFDRFVQCFYFFSEFNQDKRLQSQRKRPAPRSQKSQLTLPLVQVPRMTLLGCDFGTS